MTFARRLISNSPRFLAAFLLAAAGCSVSEAGKIPCQDDSSCPRDYPSCQSGFCAEGTGTPANPVTAAVLGVPGKSATDPVRGTVNVQVSAKAISGVKSVSIAAGGKTFPSAGTPADAVYSVPIDTKTLTDGSVTLTATVTGADGTTAAPTGTILVDNTPPTLTAGAVTGVSARAGTLVSLDVTANETLSTIRGSVVSGTTEVAVLAPLAPPTGNVFHLGFSIPQGLAAGDYGIGFTAADIAGNPVTVASAATFHVYSAFQLGSLAPTVTNASVTGAVTYNGAPAGNQGSTVSVALAVPAGVVLASNGVPTATWTSLGASSAQAMTVTGTAAAGFVATYTIQASDLDGLAVINASLTDSAGNTSSSSAQVLVKNAKPVVNGGAAGILVLNSIAGPHLPLSFSFSTSEAPASSTVQANGHAATCTQSGTSFSCSYTPSTVTDLTTPQVLPNVPVSIALVDSIGNSSSSQTTVTFDSQLPGFTVGSLTPTSFPSAGTQLTLDVTTNKPTSAFSTVVRLAATPFTVLGSFVEQPGSPVGNLHHLSFAVPNTITPASYTIAINAKDIAQNVASEVTLPLTVQAPLTLSGFTIGGSSVTQSGVPVFRAGALGTLTVSVNVPQGATLSTTTGAPNPLFVLTDSAGHQRNLPAATITASGGNNNVYTTNANILVPPNASSNDQDGVASISVVATSVNGAASTALSGNLVVDNTGPVFPASGAGALKALPSPLRKNQTLTLTATANEPLQSGTGAITVTESPSTGATYSCALDGVTNRTVTCTANIVDTSSESVTVTLHVKDLVGNSSGAGSNAASSYAVDNLTPTFGGSALAVTVPASATVHVGQQVTIAGTTNKAVVGASVQTNRGDPGACSLDVAKTGVTCIISVTDSSTESDTATVTLTDAVGNVSPGANALSGYQVQFSVDNTPPTFSGAVLASSTLKSGQSTTLTLTASKFLAVSGTRVVLSTGSQSVSFNPDSCTSSGTPTCTFTVTQGALTASTPGATFTLSSVTMTDTVGNTATVAASTPSLYVDTLAPTIASPASSNLSFLPTVIGNGGTSILTITATAPESLVTSFASSNASVTLSNGTTTLPAVNATSCSGTTCTFNFVQNNSTLPDGTYTVASVTLFDTAGNAGVIATPANSVTLNVSGAGPAVPSFSAFSPTIVGSGGSTTVTMNVNKPLDATGTFIRIDNQGSGTQVFPTSCTNQGSGNTCSFTITQANLGATGTHTIAKVVEKDLALNITTFTSGFGAPSVQVDAAAPVFSSIGSFSPGTVNGGSATSTQITVTSGNAGSDGTGGKPTKTLSTASTMVISGITFTGPSCTALSCTFTINGSALPQSNRATFTATSATLVDEAGNSATVAIPATQPTFLFDNVAPTFVSAAFSGLTNAGLSLTNTSVTLTVTGSEALDVSSTATLTKSTSGTLPLGGASACSSSSCTWTIASGTLVSGTTYTLTSVTLKDLALNSTTAVQSSPAFTFDTGAPTYVSSSFSAAGPLKAGQSTNLTITANKIITTASTATITAGSQSLTLSPSSCNSGVKTCTFAVAVNALVSTPTPPTTYTLSSVTLVDQTSNSLANNSPGVPASFSLDTAPPVVATASFDKSLVKTGTVTLTVTAVNAPENLDQTGNVAKTSAILTSSAAASPLTIALTCNGSQTCTGTATVGGNLGSGSTGDATWTLASIFLTDTATNTSTTSSGLSASFVVDTTAPTKPTLGTWSPTPIGAGGTTSMTINMNKPLQSALMTLSATNGGTASYKLAGACGSTAGNPCVFSYTQGTNPGANGNAGNAADGTYTVSNLSLTDLAGNNSPTNSYSTQAFVIDSAGPTIAGSGNSIVPGPAATVNPTQSVTVTLNVSLNVGQILTAANATLTPQTGGVGDAVTASATSLPCTTSCVFTFNSATNGTLFTNSGTSPVSYKLTAVTLSDGTTTNNIGISGGGSPNLSVSFDNVSPLLDSTNTKVTLIGGVAAASPFAVKGATVVTVQLASSNKNLGTSTAATLVGSSSTGGTISISPNGGSTSCTLKACTMTFTMPSSGVASDTVFNLTGVTLVDTANNSNSATLPSPVFVLYDIVGPTVALGSAALGKGGGANNLLGPTGSPNTVLAGIGNTVTLTFAVTDEAGGSGLKSGQSPGAVKIGTDCAGGGGNSISFNSGTFAYAAYALQASDLAAASAASGYLCVDVPAGTFVDNAGNGNVALNGQIKIPVDFSAPSLSVVGSVTRTAGTGSTTSGQVQLRAANGATTVNLYDATGTTAVTGCTAATVSTSSTSPTLVNFVISCLDTAAFTVTGNAITNKVKAVDVDNLASSAVGTAGRNLTIGYSNFASGNKTDAFSLMDNAATGTPNLNPAALPANATDIKGTVPTGATQTTGAWQAVTTGGTAPSPRVRPTVAYDSTNRQLVMLGGVGATGVPKTDGNTFILNMSGTPTWSSIAQFPSGSGCDTNNRWTGAMASGNNKIFVLHGGECEFHIGNPSNALVDQNDYFAFNTDPTNSGQTWVNISGGGGGQIANAASLNPGEQGAMIFDGTKFVNFGALALSVGSPTYAVESVMVAAGAANNLFTASSYGATATAVPTRYGLAGAVGLTGLTSSDGLFLGGLTAPATATAEIDAWSGTALAAQTASGFTARAFPASGTQGIAGITQSALVYGGISAACECGSPAAITCGANVPMFSPNFGTTCAANGAGALDELWEATGSGSTVTWAQVTTAGSRGVTPGEGGTSFHGFIDTPGSGLAGFYVYRPALQTLDVFPLYTTPRIILAFDITNIIDATVSSGVTLSLTTQGSGALTGVTVQAWNGSTWAPLESLSTGSVGAAIPVTTPATFVVAGTGAFVGRTMMFFQVIPAGATGASQFNTKSLSVASAALNYQGN